MDICFRKVDVRWATQCYYTAVIRLPQSRARVVDFRVSSHWPVSSLAKKVAVHPLTNGRCRDCLVWDVDEAWRSEQPVWSETAVTIAFLPRRAAYDTDASASCEEENKVDAADGKTTYRRQADVPAAVDGAWHIFLVPNAGVRCARARWVRDTP